MKLNIQALVNLILIFFELIVFFIGIEFYSGGICEYWRCQTIYVTFWMILIIIHGIINIYFFIDLYEK